MLSRYPRAERACGRGRGHGRRQCRRLWPWPWMPCRQRRARSGSGWSRRCHGDRLADDEEVGQDASRIASARGSRRSPRGASPGRRTLRRPGQLRAATTGWSGTAADGGDRSRRPSSASRVNGAPVARRCPRIRHARPTPDRASRVPASAELMCASAVNRSSACCNTSSTSYSSTKAPCPRPAARTRTRPPRPEGASIRADRRSPRLPARCRGRAPSPRHRADSSTVQTRPVRLRRGRGHGGVSDLVLPAPGCQGRGLVSGWSSASSRGRCRAATGSSRSGWRRRGAASVSRWAGRVRRPGSPAIPGWSVAARAWWARAASAGRRGGRRPS
ncbi:hypothetical protein BX265_7241 [Streptomyces sp. TLI_235]|nr:hypothetical protein BX265_7241 [Streptomyces sp. TLI_235]